MLDTFFLDANIYLELPFPEGNYDKECEVLFSNDSIKRSSIRVKGEVEQVSTKRMQVIPDLIRHYKRNRGRKFLPSRQIDERTFQFANEALDYVGKSDPHTILKRLRDLLDLLGKSIEARFQRTSKPLIPASSNVTLHSYLIGFIKNPVDAWHVVDASEWAVENGSMVFCTIDTEILDPSNDISACLCSHYEVSACSCPLTFSHIINL